MIRYRTPASRDSSRERRAQALRDAGIEPRDDTDRRTTWRIDIDGPAGERIRWRCEPRRGHATYRVIDEDAGALVMCSAPKTIALAIAARMPRVMSMRRCE